MRSRCLILREIKQELLTGLIHVSWWKLAIFGYVSRSANHVCAWSLVMCVCVADHVSMGI